ncbi:MAG: hypothetical protein Q8909_11990 [Bacteroidota bacterium]|nr:hypothetical protein [Bacteroidota bacterium]
MGDLYFNELSVDFSVSKQPKDKEEAKKLLLDFIKSFLAYRLSTGLDELYILSENIHSIRAITPSLADKTDFFEILNELEDESLIDEIEKKLFKASITETFVSDWNPEYGFTSHIAFGLGAASKNKSYSISYCTDYINSTSGWNTPIIPVTKQELNEQGIIEESIMSVNHIANIQHVFVDHQIWKTCKCINNSPSKSLLPRKDQSKIIPEALFNTQWNQFYSEVQTYNVSQIKILGEVVALVNGWGECRSKDNRLTFNAKNYYLAVDTQHATYEVYIGTDSHQGETKFCTDVVDQTKQDKRRKLDLLN